MPKEIIYTCNCCGKTFKEPNGFDNYSIGEVFYRYIAYNPDSSNHKSLYSLENGYDCTVYLCPDCVDKFNKLLKQMGFTKLYAMSIFDEDEIDL